MSDPCALCSSLVGTQLSSLVKAMWVIFLDMMKLVSDSFIILYRK